MLIQYIWEISLYQRNIRVMRIFLDPTNIYLRLKIFTLVLTSWKPKVNCMNFYVPPDVYIAILVLHLWFRVNNCAQRHIRPLYVNFGGVRVWHSSAQPFLIHLIFLMQYTCWLCRAHQPQWPPQRCNTPSFDQSEA